jgi:hypothetical protein
VPQREIIPMAWLYRQVERDEAERIFADDRGVPFGSACNAWIELCRGLTDADRLYIYDSRAHIGPDACANMGVCVVRHGRVTRHLLVRIG